MTLPVKLGLAALGTAGVATSAYYGGSFLMGKKEKDMPLWRPLVEDSGFLNSSGTGAQPSSEFTNKYSSDKARLLVGASFDETSSQVKNKDWWNWVFRSRYENRREEFKGGFKDLKRGAKGDKTDGKSIQEACDTVYKSNTNKIKSGDLTENSTDEFKEEQVWLLCSAVENKPKTVEELESVDGSIDKQKLSGDWQSKLGATKKSDLLAMHGETNVKVWEELNRQYKAAKPTSGFFKLEDDSQDIRNKCDDAYKKDSVGEQEGKPTESDLYKWCSFKGYKSSGS